MVGEGKDRHLEAAAAPGAMHCALLQVSRPPEGRGARVSGPGAPRRPSTPSWGPGVPGQCGPKPLPRTPKAGLDKRLL